MKKWLTDIRQWWGREILPLNVNAPAPVGILPPVARPLPMPSVKSPRVEPVEAELEALKKEKRVLAIRIENLRRDWPAIHSDYFTVAGEKKRQADQPRKRRKKRT